MRAAGSSRRDARRLVERAGLVAVTIALGAVLALWSLLAPPLSGVDEPMHFNSVLRLMQGQGWPPPHTGPVLEGTYVARQEAGYPYSGTSTLPSLPVPEERSVVVPLDGSSYEGASRGDWMSQHPPTYYAVAAGTMTLLGGAEWRWDELLLGLRLFSVVLTTAAVAVALATARMVAGSPGAAVVGALGLLAVPQLVNIQSLVTNDALGVLVGAALVYFLAAALMASRDGGPTPWPQALGAALCLGVALLTKGTMLTAVPVVLVVLAVVGWRTAPTLLRRAAPAVAGMALAFAIGGWYYLRNMLVYGELQASNSGSEVASEPFDGYSLGGYAQQAGWQLVRTFWGSKREALELSPTHVWSLTVLAVVVVVVALVWSPDRDVLATLAIAPACVVGLLVVHGWRVYFGSGDIVGLQGRYLFPMISLLVLALALVWSLARGPLARRARLLVTLGWTGVMIWLGWSVTELSFSRRWGAGGWEAMTQTWALPAGLIDALPVVAVVAAAAAGTCAALSSRWTGPTGPTRPDGRDGSTPDRVDRADRLHLSPMSPVSASRPTRLQDG